jgi:hypothetical protein
MIVVDEARRIGMHGKSAEPELVPGQASSRLQRQVETISS